MDDPQTGIWFSIPIPFPGAKRPFPLTSAVQRPLDGNHQIQKGSRIMHHLRQAVWGDIWKCTLEKSETNATSAIMLPLNQAIWGHIWKDTIEKNCITIYDILLSISIYLSCLVWLTDYPTREVLEITWKKYDKIMMFRICTKSNYYLSCWWRWRWWVGKTSLTDWLC